MKNKYRKILLTIIGTLLVLTLGVTYAYFGGTAGPGASTDIDLEALNVEKLIFNKGEPIKLSLNSVTLAEGGGNVTGESTATATLVASETIKNSTANYNVYLNILKNEFVYSTVDETPEIIVQITDADGNNVTNISGLTYTTVANNKGESISGFDVTTKTGKFDIKLNEAIASTDFVTGVTESWHIKVYFINLATNQTINANKSMNMNILMTQRENTMLNEIIDSSAFYDMTADIRKDTDPIIDEMRFSSTKSSDYNTASLKWDVSANTGSEEVIAYIEDHVTDGRILHVQANGDVLFYGDIDKDDSSVKSYFDNVDFINFNSNVNTSNVTDMSYMFKGLDATNINLDGIDTSNVTDMRGMFSYSNIMNLNLSGFNTGGVKYMNTMFSNTAATYLDLSSFDTSEVIYMDAMFESSDALNLDLSNFDTGNVTSMSSMFENSAATVLNISGFDTKKVEYMDDMFRGVSLSSLDLNSFSLEKLRYIDGMFASANIYNLHFKNSCATNALDMNSLFLNSYINYIDMENYCIAHEIGGGVNFAIDRSYETELYYLFETIENAFAFKSGIYPVIFIKDTFPATEFKYYQSEIMSRGIKNYILGVNFSNVTFTTDINDILP